MATFAEVSRQLGNVAPSVECISAETWTEAKLAGHQVWLLIGMVNRGVEHGSGLSVDFLVHKHDAGQWVRDYLWTHRSRHHLKHVIWDRHITSTTTRPGVVREMADRGSPTQNHEDHVHALWLPGDYTPPLPKYQVRTLARGMRGDDVAELQRSLNAVFDFTGPMLAVDGSFGVATEEDVKSYQRRFNLVDDGRVGPKTRASMARTGINL